MANIGDVTARLRADVSDYVAGFQRATEANQQLTATVNQNSQAFRLSQQGIDQAVAAYDRAMASTSGLRAGIDVLKADVEQATADFKAGLISVQDYRTALDQARQSALGLRTGGGLNGAELSAVNSILVKTAPAAEGAVSGLSRVAMAAGLLASQASGTGFIVGRLVAAIGLTTASAPVVIGVLGGIAALVLGYKALTADAEAAAEATKKLETALASQARAGQGPAVTRGQNLGALAAEHRAAIQALHDAEVMAQHERAAGPLGDQVADAQQRMTDALVARHNAMVPLLDEGTKELNSLKEQGFALTHTSDQVIAYREALDGVPPKLIAMAAAQERVNQTTKLQQEGLQILTEIATDLAGTGVLPSLAQEIAAIPPVSIDLSEPWVEWRQSLEAVRSPLDDVLDRVQALKVLNAEATTFRHPGGVIAPGEQTELGALGIDPADFQRQLDLLGAPLDKATADVQDRFANDMSRVGREGIRALLSGIMNGENDLLSLLKKTLLDFLTAGISDVVDGFFNGSLGVSGGSGSGISGAAAVSGGLALHFHQSPLDPTQASRDGRFQNVIRETMKVAYSQGFRLP